jgi:hypothetical protein
MPTTINLVDGTASIHLSAGDHFAWENNTDQPVVVSNCSEFCVGSTYTVPARTATGPGLLAGQINSNPADNWTFVETPSVWRPGVINPGVPHVQNPPVMHRDVA